MIAVMAQSPTEMSRTNSYTAPSAPLHNPLPEGWADRLHQVASQLSARAEAGLAAHQSSPSTDKQRTSSLQRDLEIAKAMEWLTEHPPLR